MLPLSVVNKNFPRRAVPAMPTVDTKTTADFNHSFFLSTEAFPSCKPIVKNLHAVTVGKMMKDPASTSEHLGALLILLFVLISLVTRNGDDKTVRKTKADQRETEATNSMEGDQPGDSPRVSKDDDSIPSLHPHEHHSSDFSVSTSGDVDAHAASDDEEETIKTREESVLPVQEHTTQEEESPVTKEVSTITSSSPPTSPSTSPPTSTARTSMAPSFQTAMLSAAAVTLLAVTLTRSRK